MKKNYRLNIPGYIDNAATKFSYFKLLIFIVISVFLTTSLAVTSLSQNYEGKALVFTLIAFVLIFIYTIMNIVALVKKIINDKRKKTR